MPRVSIVLPAYFSHGTLAASLAALSAQSRPADEIIVVNSSPDPETAPVVAAFPKVRLIQSPHRLLPHAARNRGFAEAIGEVLVCSDPDCVAAPDWLQALVAVLEKGHPLVGGSMGLRPPRGPGSRLQEAIHLAKFWWILPGLPAGPVWIVPTANCAFTRRLWEQVGPFPDDVFCGDALFSWRASRAGSVPWFAPEAIVAHEHDETAAMMRRQRWRRGQEFGRERARWEGWNAGTRWTHALASPLRCLRVLHRARNAAMTAGWGESFRRTTALHAGFQAAWVAGEARAWMQRPAGSGAA